MLSRCFTARPLGLPLGLSFRFRSTIQQERALHPGTSIYHASSPVPREQDIDRILHSIPDPSSDGQPTILAFSGGVDSSIAAHLLKLRGHKVSAIFLKCWDNHSDDYVNYPVPNRKGNTQKVDETLASNVFMTQAQPYTLTKGKCPFEEEKYWAEKAAEFLKVDDFIVHDFTKEYWNDVFIIFLEQVRQGMIPNPDILCNTAIKFGSFLETFRKNSLTLFSTGHHARIARYRDGEEQKLVLLKGVDPEKDQTYFLARVSEQALSQCIFPIGAWTKNQIRAFAVNLGLPSAHRRSSRGICFVGKRPFSDFLKQYIDVGDPDTFRCRIMSIDGGKPIRILRKFQYYSLGQKARIGGVVNKLYVVGKYPWSDGPTYGDGSFVLENDVVVCEGRDHEANQCLDMLVSTPFWIDGKEPHALTLQRQKQEGGGFFECQYRLEHGVLPMPCRLAYVTHTRGAVDPKILHVHFENPQRLISHGQTIVFYSNDRCLGSAIVCKNGKSIWKMKQKMDTNSDDNSQLSSSMSTFCK